MKAFLDSVLDPSTAVSEDERCRRARAQLRQILESASKEDRRVVRRAEEEVRERPERAFRFDASGNAHLEVGGMAWGAGRFETPTLRELRSRLQGGGSRRLTFSVLDGASPLTDIGALQAMASPGTLFQVASQFNCLESPGFSLVPVRAYFDDPTQGPRASISAFPATLLRHYSAPSPDGRRFVQETGSEQIELLASACGSGVAPNGYLTGHRVESPDALAQDLEEKLEAVRVGVHEGCQVVRGFNWDGAVTGSVRIGQVFTSTVAGGYYGAEASLGSAAFVRVSRQLLRAAYLGTMLAAASLKKRTVILTLIGGGVFQNPIELIWESILWALEEVEPWLSVDLTVVLNGRSLGSGLDIRTVVLPEVTRRGGSILRFNANGLEEIIA